jgi:hypothetical protein
MSDTKAKRQVFVIAEVSNNSGKTEYWTGDITQRRYSLCPEMTSNISMAKTYCNEKVAQKSAKILYGKTEGKHKFTVIKIEEGGS